jgi:RNA polymerase subunit RPABC4/transcription elongation factor Spt4
MSSVLEHNGLHPDSHDKCLEDGRICDNNKRPDFVFHRNGYVVVLEVDERQHAKNFISGTSSYTCECELSRMILIHQTLGQPVIFFRYNPDGYIDVNGDHHPPSNTVERDTRVVDYLKRLMTHWDQMLVISEGLYVYYFYYDGAPVDIGHDAVPDKYVVDYMNQTVTKL